MIDLIIMLVPAILTNSQKYMEHIIRPLISRGLLFHNTNTNAIRKEASFGHWNQD